MPRFRFKLEPLLKARRQVEQDKQLAVAAIQRQRTALENKLRARQQFIVKGKQSLRGRLTGTLQMPALRSHAAATIHQMREAQRIVIELAGVHRRLDAARAELIEARRDRRAVELLRERRYMQWRAALNKAEDDALDELAVQAAARKEQ